MVKKKKKHSNIKLVVSLIFMSLVLAFSVGGLTIIKAVNANEGDNSTATNSDIVSESDMVDSDYISSSSGTNKKEQVKIESVDQAINLINTYFTTKAYVVTSTGKMNVAGKVDGIMDYNKLCNLEYWDYFEHETNGRAYWEEGTRMGEFYNSFIETIYKEYMSISGQNISNLSRFYYLNDETFFHQRFNGVKFINGFNVDENLKNSTGISQCSTSNDLKNMGYQTRYFRWTINNNTVKNAVLIKTISGYQFDFDLVAETGARDVYKRFATWIPQNILRNVSPGKFHYSYTFDRFGNVVSFTRDETINMSLTGKNIGIAVTGSGGLTFNFRYNVKTKDDSYKIAVDDPFAKAIASAGFEL